MKHTQVATRNRALIVAGLGTALLVAVFLSPFASQAPDGLDRVSKDLKFADKATEDSPAKKLPFHLVFEEYKLRGVPEQVATPLAGLIGTLATFGLAWGAGKIFVKGERNPPLDEPSTTDRSPE